MRIVFMGTPDFGIPSLEKLLNSKHEVVGVVTAPDKPRGRGLRLSESPVKKFSKEHNLKVLTPESLKSDDFFCSLEELTPDLSVVVAFRILPERIFTLPKLGTINLHASLLPKYRGAAPINWAIINGETKTGLTTFYIQKKVDTGDLILQKEIDILPEENFGELHDRMAKLGAALLLQTLDLIEKGDAKPTKQDHAQATPAPKINREHCQIDWSKEAVQIRNQIRGLSPIPAAFTLYKARILKIYQSKVIGETLFSNGFGEVVESDSKEKIWIKTKKGILNVLELQSEGKRKMTAEEFIRGYRIQVGEKLG
ncbi:MAG: methionyl-tRNA formyltransferase [candidate division Zixibacteria bacterium]|nr:methionyl-tRNA formyltransferase [candidate division Zixibacteria bacterium]